MRKKSLNTIRFLQLLLNRIKQKNTILYTYYNEKELEKYDIDQEEASYGLHIIQNIEGPELVVLIRRIGDTIR
jgi:nanoRNase/pAp phosphatase (c-di-AMP/oligoRNAs hydrolase)